MHNSRSKTRNAYSTLHLKERRLVSVVVGFEQFLQVNFIMFSVVMESIKRQYMFFRDLSHWQNQKSLSVLMQDPIFLQVVIMNFVIVFLVLRPIR